MSGRHAQQQARQHRRATPLRIVGALATSAAFVGLVLVGVLAIGLLIGVAMTAGGGAA